MVNKVLFSHKSDEWETPQNLFDELNQEFNFDVDVCATPENAKCDKFFTIEQDGLTSWWHGNVWCNPPYSEIKYWVEKAYNRTGLSVLLVPARTDTKWFHEYCYQNPNCEIRFIKGRLKFNNSKNSAPFPSMILIFNNSPEPYDGKIIT